jgi:hypothetical protein
MKNYYYATGNFRCNHHNQTDFIDFHKFVVNEQGFMLRFERFNFSGRNSLICTVKPAFIICS